MSIITLTSDYGLKDHFVGALKGKILSEHPEAVIVDISHDIDPFNTAEASYIVGAAYSGFPEGSVHIIGVDSEMTPDTRHLAMQWNGHYFICADNGILGLLSQKITPGKIVAINIHDRFPGDFTDLDVFVKVGCHLAKGGLLNVIGKETTELKRPTELQPVASKDSIKGYVVYVDHFGNVVTNISRNMFKDVARGRAFEIVLSERGRPGMRSNIRKIGQKYADVVASARFDAKNYEGTKLALFNEAGFLEIAIYRPNPQTTGTASTLLGLAYRDVVTINFINP